MVVQTSCSDGMVNHSRDKRKRIFAGRFKSATHLESAWHFIRPYCSNNILRTCLKSPAAIL